MANREQGMQRTGKVFVRDFVTHSIVKEIEVYYAPDSSQYDRFFMGLMRNMDTEKYYIDDDEYVKKYGGKV